MRILSVHDVRWEPYADAMLTICMRIENSGWKARSNMTQEDKILRHLRKAGSITVREAMSEYSIQSLTKRISTLRKQGHNIVSKVRSHPITGQRYVRYHLASA